MQVWSGPLVVAAILGSIPLLFAIGRRHWKESQAKD